MFDDARKKRVSYLQMAGSHVKATGKRASPVVQVVRMATPAPFGTPSSDQALGRWQPVASIQSNFKEVQEKEIDYCVVRTYERRSFLVRLYQMVGDLAFAE